MTNDNVVYLPGAAAESRESNVVRIQDYRDERTSRNDSMPDAYERERREAFHSLMGHMRNDSIVEIRIDDGLVIYIFEDSSDPLSEFFRKYGLRSKDVVRGWLGLHGTTY